MDYTDLHINKMLLVMVLGAFCLLGIGLNDVSIEVVNDYLIFGTIRFTIVCIEMSPHLAIIIVWPYVLHIFCS